MRLLTRRFDTAGLLVLRVVVGALVAAHGLQKLTTAGPAGFGRETLAGLGVPLPVLAGYVVTFAELAGGVLLILGLLTRLAALVLTVDLVVAILLVKVNVGLIAMRGVPSSISPSSPPSSPSCSWGRDASRSIAPSGWTGDLRARGVSRRARRPDFLAQRALAR